MPQPLLLLITDVVIMSHESAAQRRCEPWRPVVVESAFTEGAFDSGCVFLTRQEKRGHGWHRSDRFPCLLRWKRNVVPVCAGEGKNALQSPLLLPPRRGMKFQLISAKFCETIFMDFFSCGTNESLWSVAESEPENALSTVESREEGSAEKGQAQSRISWGRELLEERIRICSNWDEPGSAFEGSSFAKS